MKNDFHILLVSSFLGLATFGQAQQPVPKPPQPPAAAREQAPVQEPTAQRWIEQLGSESYRERLEAETRLRALGKAAVPGLEKAAEQDRDGEVQWRARRLLRQIEQGTGPEKQQQDGLVERNRGNDREPEAVRPGAPSTPWRSADGDDMRAQFDRLFRGFERDFGLDIPRHRFFADGFFRDLQSQLEKAPAVGNGSGMSVQIGPSGVRVEVTETDENGKSERKVYEAPDLETFKEQYPNVLQDNGLGMGLSPFGGRLPGVLRGQIMPGWRDLDRSQTERMVIPFVDRQPTAAPMPAEGQRLGVVIGDLPDALRDHLELDPDTGLMVKSVQPNTLAQALGLRAGDIVIAINGQRIGSASDVKTTLVAIDKGEAVKVEFLRKGRSKTAETTKRTSGQASGGGKVLRERSNKAGGSIR